MKILLTEIWHFLDVTSPEPYDAYHLIAGNIRVENIPVCAVNALKSDPEYDTELLPSLFTFREILWQPDIIPQVNIALTSLRVLQSFCTEQVEVYEKLAEPTSLIYSSLLTGMAECCERAINALDKESSINIVLSSFRLEAFPIVKFFVLHPGNRQDYFLDASNRLNFAVKVMLTEFHSTYSQLLDPYWEVDFPKSPEEDMTGEIR